MYLGGSMNYVEMPHIDTWKMKASRVVNGIKSTIFGNGPADYVDTCHGINALFMCYI